MNGKNMALTPIVVMLILNTPALIYGENNSIEGDWQMISDEEGLEQVIRIQSQADGTLSAFVFDKDAGGASERHPLDEVTFENGKLRFEVTSKQIVFEGTMQEDGLTIEGQLQVPEQTIALVLKHIDTVPSETAKAQREIEINVLVLSFILTH